MLDGIKGSRTHLRHTFKTMPIGGLFRWTANAGLRKNPIYKKLSERQYVRYDEEKSREDGPPLTVGRSDARVEYV